MIFREQSTRKSLMEETLSKAVEFDFFGVNKRSRRPQTIIQVRRYPPPEIWFKLNTNDSLSRNPDRAGGRWNY